jgi:hypothetical protein
MALPVLGGVQHDHRLAAWTTSKPHARVQPPRETRARPHLAGCRNSGAASRHSRRTVRDASRGASDTASSGPGRSFCGSMAYSRPTGHAEPCFGDAPRGPRKRGAWPAGQAALLVRGGVLAACRSSCRPTTGKPANAFVAYGPRAPTSQEHLARRPPRRSQQALLTHLDLASFEHRNYERLLDWGTKPNPAKLAPALCPRRRHAPEPCCWMTSPRFPRSLP